MDRACILLTLLADTRATKSTVRYLSEHSSSGSKGEERNRGEYHGEVPCRDSIELLVSSSFNERRKSSASLMSRQEERAATWTFRVLWEMFLSALSCRKSKIARIIPLYRLARN